jgi:PKD repeat protein
MRRTMAFVLALMFVVPLSAMAAPTEEGPVAGRAVTIPPPEVQSAIKKIADGVSKEYLISYNTQLQDYGSRYARSPNMWNCTQWLHDCLLNDSRMTSEFHNFSYVNATGVTHWVRSVILTLPGLNTSSNAVYYIYNHVDSMLSFGQFTLDDLLYNNCPGADDDGSGVAATLEAARVMRKFGFQDTIKFAFFNGEELGLLGSGYYMQDMKNKNENVQGGIDYDMIGYCQGNAQYDLDLEWNAASAWQGQHYMDVNNRYGIGLKIEGTQVSGSIPSDVTRFYNLGYPSVFGIEWTFSPVYHTKADRVDLMNFTFVQKLTKLAVAELAEMARLLYVDVSIDNDSVSASTVRPNEGDNVVITANVNNTGSLNASDLEVAFYDNGVEFASNRIWVPANGTNVTTANWKAVQGSHVITVELDPVNEIVETNETNNTAFITVAVNDKPRAVLSAVPLTIMTNDTVSFNGSFSMDSIGGVSEYNFTFGDGSGTGWVGKPDAGHVYPNDGKYTASLQVKDPEGALSNVASVNITVLNRAPSAFPRCDPVRTLTFVPVHFHSNASDPDGTVTTLWDMGDGCRTAEANPVHAYDKAGTYDIQLDIRDNDGAGSSYDLRVMVDDRPPVCSINASLTAGTIETEFTFSANASDVDGTIVKYEWDLGDGTTSSIIPVKHNYARPGTYAIRLTVRDDDDSVANALVNITVIDTPPVAVGSVIPNETNTFKRVMFIGEKSSDLEGPVTYAWYFGDGNTSAEMSPYHSYNQPGEYLPALTVTDSAGHNNTTFLPVVKVLNRLPKALFRAFGNFSENGTLYFDGTNSSDPEGPVTYAWVLGDGAVAAGPVVEHRFPKAGSYNVTLTVTDTDSGRASDTQLIVVILPPPPPVIVKPKPKPTVEDKTGLVNMLMALSIILLVLLVVVAAYAATRKPKRPQEQQTGPPDGPVAQPYQQQAPPASEAPAPSGELAPMPEAPTAPADAPAAPPEAPASETIASAPQGDAQASPASEAPAAAVTPAPSEPAPTPAPEPQSPAAPSEPAPAQPDSSQAKKDDLDDLLKSLTK